MTEKKELPEKRILAECVFQHRTRMEESQEIFAEGCEMSTDMISLIERGKTNPSLSTLAKISKHIGISVSDMLKPEGKDDK